MSDQREPMPQNPDHVIAALLAANSWITSTELALRLGVSERSVRIHVAAARGAAAPYRIIEASNSGYRLNRSEYADYLSSTQPSDLSSPRQDRLRFMIRALTLATDGLAIDKFASELFVSESTVEADIRRLRTIAAGSGVTVGRKGNVLTLSGSGQARRRLLSGVFRADGAVGYLEHQALEMNGAASRMRNFKSGVIGWIESTGRGVNEYGIASVLLHAAIAIDRADQMPSGSPRASGAWSEQESLMAALIREHFNAELVEDDLYYLSQLLESRATTHSVVSSGEYLNHATLSLTHQILTAITLEHAITITDPTMEHRLAMHIENMLKRARSDNPTRNPMIQSIKLSHPFIFDVAVDIARHIEAREHVAISEDEISFIALHLGMAIAPLCKAKTSVTVALVCPSYYDMIDVLRQRIESEFGDEITITSLISRMDIDTHDLDEDIVITTLTDTAVAEHWVQIHPFLTDTDLHAIRNQISQVKEHALTNATEDTLRAVFTNAVFISPLDASSPTSAIAQLSDLMYSRKMVDAAFIDRCLERERRSSCDFTTAVAFPHAQGTDPEGTKIAIGLLKSPIRWGAQNVRIVVLVAQAPRADSDAALSLEQIVNCFRDVDRMQSIANNFIENAVLATGLTTQLSAHRATDEEAAAS